MSLASRDASPWCDLPEAVLQACLLLVPVDQRAACACVCRSWRTAASAGALWQRLDLSFATGGLRRPLSRAVLRGALSRARGHLQSLDVTGDPHGAAISTTILLSRLPAHAATLTELRLSHASVARIRDLLRAVPRLEALYVAVRDTPNELAPVLRREPPFGTLRLRGVHATEHVVLLVEWLRYVSTHTDVRELSVDESYFAHNGEEMQALADAVLNLRLTRLDLTHCEAQSLPALLPGLMQVFGSDTLTSFSFQCADWVEPLSVENGEALGDALQANRTLTSLSLYGRWVWWPEGCGVALVRALRNHSLLQHIGLSGRIYSTAAEKQQIGTALSELLAADCPALTSLDISCCDLEDAGMTPVVAALSRNSHIRKLNILRNRTSSQLEDAMLGAVKDCKSLRELDCDNLAWGGAAIRYVLQRNAARLEAGVE
jgi:hypothetical protein